MSFSDATPKRDDTKSDMTLEELEDDFDAGVSKQWREIQREKELRDSKFLAHCASCNREIEAARQDIEALMVKSYAYARSTGLESEGITLPRTSPRHNYM